MMRALASGDVRLHDSNAWVAVSSAMSASRSVAAATRPTTCEGLAGLTETISPSVSTLLPPMTSGWLFPREPPTSSRRSEEHTSELQSRQYLVCRLLLEKKKKRTCILSHRHTTADI